MMIIMITDGVQASRLPLCLAPPCRGTLARSILQAQTASPIFTHVYAALVAIINSKFPQIGELILKRLILTFRKSYRRNLKVPVRLYVCFWFLYSSRSFSISSLSVCVVSTATVPDSLKVCGSSHQPECGKRCHLMSPPKDELVRS